MRSMRLIKLAETPLMAFQSQLSERSKVDIRILERAEIKEQVGVLAQFESFSQIYRWVFSLAGAGGVLIFVISTCRGLRSI